MDALSWCSGSLTITGLPALVAAAISSELAIWAATVMPRMPSTLSALMPDLVVGAVEHQVPVVPGDVERVERLDGDLDVLQRRHVEGGDQHDLVGLVERGEHLLVEGRAPCR